MEKFITIKTPKCEMELSDYCSMEYKRVILLMKLVEEEFDVSLKDHKNLRHSFLDVANFIKNIPDMLCEVITYDS